MKTKIKILLIAILSFTRFIASAEQMNLKGQILDANDHTPVPFANVLLLKQDSTYVTGVNSDMEGFFEIKNVENKGILSVSYMGYTTTYLPVSDNTETIEIFLEQSVIGLSEVTIVARSVSIKDDRRVILPTQEQMRMSSDGTDMIRKMNLPRIMVDPISGDISMSGNGVLQLRLNGVEVTSAEIASLSPADILRIEYHDDPGARYGNVDVVIDYITQRKESGGNINGVLFHGYGHKKQSIDDRMSLKYNYGKSEWAANVVFNKRKGDWTREYDEKFIFPKHELQRIEVGKPTVFDKQVFYSNLNYSLMEKDNYFFNTQLRYTRNDFPNGYEDRKGLLYISGSDSPVSIFNHTVEKSNSPALDIYFQYHLSKEQLLIFNSVGTYIDTDSKRIYQEKQETDLITDILSCIDGSKYSIITEGIYEKKIGYNKFSGGVRYLQSFTNNKYNGTSIADVSMRHSENSVYVEFQGRLEKWGYMVNLTGTRLYYSQRNTKMEKYALQPSARLTYEPNANSYLRYRINLHTNAPSLAAMNNVEQVIDAWQIRRGNPKLDSFHTLSQSFSTGYNKNIFAVELFISYIHEYKPIMESIFYENNKFIHTYENQKTFENLSAEATFKIKFLKNYINLSVTPRINRFISTGNNYLHTYTLPELRINLDFSYNNWMGNFTTITPPRSMYGEQLMKSDQMYTLMIGYKQPQWSIMFGALNPFTGKYETENKNWSALNPVNSQIHTSHNRSFLAKLSFNVNYGKQIKGSIKQINNEDTDSGIMQGVKN